MMHATHKLFFKTGSVLMLFHTYWLSLVILTPGHRCRHMTIMNLRLLTRGNISQIFLRLNPDIN